MLDKSRQNTEMRWSQATLDAVRLLSFIQLENIFSKVWILEF